MKFLKDYWVLLLFLFGAPLLLNFLLLIPSFTPIVGAETDWLSFWGGYLGAMFSAIVAFVVLFKQLKQNQEQNKLNRDSNRNENAENRALQVRILKYQMGLNNLNQFKEAYVFCQGAYSYNNLCYIVNLAHEDKFASLSLIKSSIEEVISANRRISLVDHSDTQTAKAFYCGLYSLHMSYNDALSDLQILISSLDSSEKEASIFLNSGQYSSSQLQEVVFKHIKDIPADGVNATIDKIISERLDMFNRGLISALWQKANDYIQEEKEVLNKPLDGIAI